MARPPKAFAYAEFKDGREYDGIRLTFETKVQLNKTMKAQHWTAEKDSALVDAFASWHALKVSGALDLSWDEFRGQIVDAGLYTDDGSDVDLTTPDEDDPTNADLSAI